MNQVGLSILNFFWIANAIPSMSVRNNSGLLQATYFDGSVCVNSSYAKDLNGWNYLVVSSRHSYSIEDTFKLYYAAGFLEGYSSHLEIKQSYPNFLADNFEGPPPMDLINFIYDNYIWMKTESDLKYKTSKYWFTLKCILNQLEGITNGFLYYNDEKYFNSKYQNVEYNQRSAFSGNYLDILNTDKFSLLHVLMLNAWGDLYDISMMLELTNTDNNTRQDTSVAYKDIPVHLRDEACDSNSFQQDSHVKSLFCPSKLRMNRIPYPYTRINRDLRCSAIIKLLPNDEDILFGHTTWTSYTGLGPRIFKRYVLPSLVQFADDTMSQSILFDLRDTSFSSYAANVASLDDFYTIVSPKVNLVVMETTNSILNENLYLNIKHTSNLMWVRVVVANTIATSGITWSESFSYKQSGTYPNQYQIIDLSKFSPMESPAVSEGLLTILEEVPGYVTYKDMTEMLVSDRYWGSYNIPYFEDISIITGNAFACKMAESLGSEEWCWDSAARANIFRTRQGDVQTIEDVKYLLQYNDWQHDPLSLGDACNAISCRRDLEENIALRYPSGGIDSKISSAALIFQSAISHQVENTYDISSMIAPTVHMRMGPTHDDQPVFCWSNLNDSYVHFGQPDCFDFDWIVLPQE